MIELLSITMDSEWEYVDRIQKLAYSQDLLEDLNVLKEKAGVKGHFCCLVLELESNSIVGYVLAHPYPKEEIPTLNSRQLASSNDESDNVFLHDLALDPTCAGKGLGKRVIAMLIGKVKKQGYKSMTLVAVQSSEQFWNKAGGFDVVVPDRETALKKYGNSAKMMQLVF